MNRVELVKIADKLATIPVVQNKCGNRVFVEIPLQEQSGIYLILSMTGDYVDTYVSKRATISVRVVAHDQNISQEEMYGILHAITTRLVYKRDETDTFDFGVFKVIEKEISPFLLDEKGRREVVKDYLFYYTLEGKN